MQHFSCDIFVLKFHKAYHHFKLKHLKHWERILATSLPLCHRATYSVFLWYLTSSMQFLVFTFGQCQFRVKNGRSYSLSLRVLYPLLLRVQSFPFFSYLLKSSHSKWSDISDSIEHTLNSNHLYTENSYLLSNNDLNS